MSAARAVALRTLAGSRIRESAYTAMFALISYANVVGYRSAYPTLAAREGFVRAFGSNPSVRLFYGEPHDLISIGGYTAWRVGGSVAIVGAIWGMLAAVGALRGEEDAGREELVLTGALSRSSAYLAALGACGLGTIALWLALFAGLFAARLPAAGSAYLALAAVSVVPVFIGVGAFASQLAPTRRTALAISSAVLILALVLRVIGDTSTGLGWLRWTTPLGWAEELRPFTGARPLVLLAPLSSAAALLTGAGLIAVRRDVGSGLLSSHDTAPPRAFGLSSPTALALRGERGTLAGWLLGTGFFALIIGLISTTVSNGALSSNLRHQLQKVGDVSFTTPSGYVGLCFLFFVLAISLFACSQLAATRREESEERLETLLALAVARRRWLAGRLALALGGAIMLSLTAALFAWLGGAIENAHISLASMLEAGLNCLPVGLLFLGLAALAFALHPRSSAGIAYGLVAAAFLWQLFGGVLEAPHWALDLSPFAHVGLVPAQPFRAGDAAAMLGLAAVAGTAAVWAFNRRDLAGQ